MNASTAADAMVVRMSRRFMVPLSDCAEQGDGEFQDDQPHHEADGGDDGKVGDGHDDGLSHP